MEVGFIEGVEVRSGGVVVRRGGGRAGWVVRLGLLLIGREGYLTNYGAVRVRFVSSITGTIGCDNAVGWCCSLLR